MALSRSKVKTFWENKAEKLQFDFLQQQTMSVEKEKYDFDFQVIVASIITFPHFLAAENLTQQTNW